MKSSYITPVVTLFDENGNLDADENLRVYDFIKDKVTGFVVMGSTGEFFSLDMKTSKALIKLASDFNRGEMKVYAGASRMDINESIELANYAYDCGLDGVMIISPYYFRLTDEAIYYFYSKIASQTNAKIFIYNFPDRTGYSVSPELCLRLAREYPNIVGIKDTIPDTNHTTDIINTVKIEIPDFEVYAGYDNNFAHNILSGGNGCIGGLSNIVPEFFKSWVNAFTLNDLEMIANHQNQVDQLMDIYKINDPFIATFKKALEIRGIIHSTRCKEPFGELNNLQIQKIKSVLSHHNIMVD
ncbi:dihydrodipicolinate synthase family protein [Pectobacterium sp. B1J-3]|uniref:dihydrodipicolinate synthase family protein n=1 Tax=Pectobacterium sp. B1J-3 TaxID=3385371 RepID=UPI0039062594